MVALKTERRVFLWRVTPRAVPREAPNEVSIAEIVEILENAWAAGTARVYLSSSAAILADDDPTRDEKHQLYIAEIRRVPERNTITFLVNRGDPNIVSPAFIDSQDSAVRVVQPTPTESVGYSAHLVMSLEADGHGHRACFEQMPRVSSSLVGSALDSIISRAVAGNPKYLFETLKRRGKRIERTARPYRPIFEIQRIPSERLRDDLQHGELSGVTLTRQREFYTGVGSRDLITKQEEKIVLKLRHADPVRVSDVVRNIIQQAKTDTYSTITFHLEKLPGNATNSPTIALDDQDALEHLYVRATRLTNFPGFLEACYSNICSDIERKMLDIVANPTHW